ncbi:hypothetical protein [Paucibacter sp. Y2R2-4]|uniref:hypothetical protein n=1 Tax=Paucibacter sp. Y2R2-4 TaxID=2893553 RepID=UPI0021E3FF1C|nr:hypothetical protein [Paucibacter sp. Y2R2-4]MCV2351805.1 hypothetical protein [Paucibacter sp. Y2R2-4]
MLRYQAATQTCGIRFNILQVEKHSDRLWIPEYKQALSLRRASMCFIAQLTVVDLAWSATLAASVSSVTLHRTPSWRLNNVAPKRASFPIGRSISDFMRKVNELPLWARSCRRPAGLNLDGQVSAHSGSSLIGCLRPCAFV